MLAEQASSISLRLPQGLRDKAHLFAGEMAWGALDAAAAILWLERNGRAVLGVELWREREGQPLWVATSDYSFGVHDVLTPDQVAWCAHKAGEFIQAHRHEPGALFNLTWDDNAR